MSSQRAGLACLRLSWLALVLVLTPLLAMSRPQPAAAAGVVSTCTEAALRNALAGGGLVTFSCSGTIPLASQIEITADTVIDGGGQVTLDGQNQTRLFWVNAGVSLMLRGLTLTGGSSFAQFPGDFDGGGAILNFGSLTVETSTLADNTAGYAGGAINNYFNSDLTIIASILSGNLAVIGGAVYTNPDTTVMITDSTFADNTAEESGGAIYNDAGTVTILASTLSDNSASFFGGAIYNGGDLTISASTLAGNSANIGGAIRNHEMLTLSASTLAGNSANHGGAIASFGTAQVWFSTLAGNNAASGGAIHNTGGSATFTANVLSGSGLCNGPITSNGYNVANDATCNITAAGDHQNADPLLGSLMHNGGPTETIMPQLASPAIDRVPNDVCITLSAANDGEDQRGAPRPESTGLACDSGAVELQNHNFFCVGERSGSLRYVSVPNGCVRGEYRLMQSADGQYAFCVGDRSGSMRYLPNSGTNCLRGETKLILPQVEPITICVGELSRSVRYVAAANQCNPRGELAYSIVNPVG